MQKIGFVAKYCEVCGKMYNGYEPLSHIPLKDCDKKLVKNMKKKKRGQI